MTSKFGAKYDPQIIAKKFEAVKNAAVKKHDAAMVTEYDFYQRLLNILDGEGVSSLMTGSYVSYGMKLYKLSHTLPSNQLIMEAQNYFTLWESRGLNRDVLIKLLNLLNITPPVISGGAGVNKIIAGTNITISPTSGVGDVTVNASGGAINYYTAESGEVATDDAPYEFELTFELSTVKNCLICINAGRVHAVPPPEAMAFVDDVELNETWLLYVQDDYNYSVSFVKQLSVGSHLVKVRFDSFTHDFYTLNIKIDVLAMPT